MIPGVMVDFLDRASVAMASTRNAALVPSIHWVVGWRFDDDGSTLVCGVPDKFTCGLAEGIRDSGRFAVAAEVIGPHECYQFKGRASAPARVTAADFAAADACRERFVRALLRHSGERYTAPILERNFSPPEVVVRLAIEEIFVQTPGPGAGARLFPPQADA